MEPSIGGCLVKLTGDTSERRIQLGVEAIHDDDDGNGDAGSDQAILNGRGAGLVLRKTRNKGSSSVNSLADPRVAVSVNQRPLLRRC